MGNGQSSHTAGLNAKAARQPAAPTQCTWPLPEGPRIIAAKMRGGGHSQGTSASRLRQAGRLAGWLAGGRAGKRGLRMRPNLTGRKCPLAQWPVHDARRRRRPRARREVTHNSRLACALDKIVLRNLQIASAFATTTAG